jgi:hypothetical protein
VSQFRQSRYRHFDRDNFFALGIDWKTRFKIAQKHDYAGDSPRLFGQVFESTDNAPVLRQETAGCRNE